METEPLPSDAPGDVAELLDRIDVALSKVEESLVLLDDPEVDPTDAVAWIDA
jgi:hypothetical protein